MTSVRPTPASVVMQGHRRDNQSVSSTHSSMSRGDREGRKRGHPAVESAVTRLLVSIKQLLESLTMWSTQQITESQVSDVYVRLGNDFNAAVAAFQAFHIDMNELQSVPDDLRAVLEMCLAEDATPENLDQYLPQVRGIITNLLQGLRGKQTQYRRIVQDHRHRSSQSSSSHGHDRTESRSSRSERSSQREGDGVRMHHSRSLPNGEQERREEGSARRSATSSASTSGVSRRKQSGSTLSQPPTTAGSDEPFIGGFVSPRQQLAPDEGAPHQPDRASAPVQPTPQRRTQAATNSYPPSSAPASDASTTMNGSPKPPETPPEEQRPETPASPPPPPTLQAPAEMKRYSLVDKPMAPPAVVVDEAPTPSPSEDVQMSARQATSTPPLDSPPLEATPAAASSLAALQKSDALERRASKRFSSYNISKMTGLKDRHALSNAGNRRSMAVGGILTPVELESLAEEGEEEGSTLQPSSGSFRRRSRHYRGTSPIAEEGSPPPVPALPSSSGSTPELSQSATNGTVDANKTEVEEPSRPRSFPVFLQIGRSVKKVTVDSPGLSLSSLRVLFVDKFSYNPGTDNFPAIYIRDPDSGILYELEDVEEVQPGRVLSLDVEPLDQIKQHIDAQMSTLSQDIKDIRALVANNRRMSHPPPMIIGQPLGESTPPPANRPTEKQFQHVARRLSRLVNTDEQTLAPDVVLPNMTGQSVMPQMTGGSVLSEYSNRVVTDLKTQFDEVQNLRRDLGIIRQLYTEFMKQTKESLGTLRNQTANVRQLAAAKVGGARQYIDDGKTKLDVRSQNALTKMEELQDLVESVKDDVLKRHVTPRPQILRSIRDDMEFVNTELESLKEHIKTIKPMWKKTWEEELQNIVEEQGFLSHQEEFLHDLLEDQKAVLEVYGHIEKVISLRGTNRPNSRGRLRPVNGGAAFTPPVAEEGHNGLSTVMLEIRNASVDPERRLKAIEASQKNREREMAKKGDEFQTELKGFVVGGKLRMTGGAEEVERVRKRRDEMALKAMFSGGMPASASGSSSGAPNGVEEEP